MRVLETCDMLAVGQIPLHQAPPKLVVSRKQRIQGYIEAITAHHVGGPNYTEFPFDAGCDTSLANTPEAAKLNFGIQRPVNGRTGHAIATLSFSRRVVSISICVLISSIAASRGL